MNTQVIRRECSKNSWANNMKNSIIKASILLFIATIMFVTTGCIDRYFGVSTEPDSLKVISPEEIDSIFAAISHETTEKYPSETDEKGNEIVFWLDGGAVWHASRACSTIKKSDPEKVKSGTVQDALESGKERLCKICGSDSDIIDSLESNDTYANSEVVSVPETDKYPKEYFENGELIVFWLEGGKVWHESRHCSSLSRSDPDKITYGSVPEAIEAGKERACKNCSE